MCHDKRYHNLPHDCTIALATAAHRDYSRSVTMADKPVTNVMPMDVEKGATTGVGGGNVASSASPVAQRRPCDKLNAWMRFTAYDDGMFTQPTCAPKVPHLLLHHLLWFHHLQRILLALPTMLRKALMPKGIGLFSRSWLYLVFFCVLSVITERIVKCASSLHEFSKELDILQS